MIDILLRLHDEIDTCQILCSPDDPQVRYDYMKYLVEEELARCGYDDFDNLPKPSKRNRR